MRDEDVAKLLERLVRLEIAIQSINPDPKETIQGYRDRLAAQQRAADSLVTATAALLNATKRLAVATWALVALTALIAGGAILGVVR
jgi:hypothetical protein